MTSWQKSIYKSWMQLAVTFFSALIHWLLNHWLSRFDKNSAKRRTVPERHCETSQYVYASRSQLVCSHSSKKLEEPVGVGSLVTRRVFNEQRFSARDRHRWLLNIRNVHRPIEDPSCDRTDVKPVSYRSELPSTIRRKETWDWRFTFSSFHAIHTAIQKG